MGQIVDSILNISPVLAALLVFALVFAEDAFFLGFVIPGETAAILGGVLASPLRLIGPPGRLSPGMRILS